MARAGPLPGRPGRDPPVPGCRRGACPAAGQHPPGRPAEPRPELPGSSTRTTTRLVAGPRPRPAQQHRGGGACAYVHADLRRAPAPSSPPPPATLDLAQPTAVLLIGGAGPRRGTTPKRGPSSAGCWTALPPGSYLALADSNQRRARPQARGPGSSNAPDRRRPVPASATAGRDPGLLRRTRAGRPPAWCRYPAGGPNPGPRFPRPQVGTLGGGSP